MILYNFNSTSPRRVRIFLAEKGIEAPMQTVDIFKPEEREAHNKQRNAFGGVPVLELDDGTFIPESVSICRYFEAVHPQPPLFGVTPLEKAMIDVWIRRLELYLLQPTGQVWINDSPITRGRIDNPNLRAAEAGRKGVHRTWKRLNEHLADNEFLAAGKYTAAEAVGLPLIDFAHTRCEVPYPDDYKHLKRWHEAISARPSAKAGLEGAEPF